MKLIVRPMRLAEVVQVSPHLRRTRGGVAPVRQHTRHVRRTSPRSPANLERFDAFRIQTAEEPLERLLDPDRADGWVASDETRGTQPRGVSSASDLEGLSSWVEVYSPKISPGQRMVGLVGRELGGGGRGRPDGYRDRDEHAVRMHVDSYEDLGSATAWAHAWTVDLDELAEGLEDEEIDDADAWDDALWKAPAGEEAEVREWIAARAYLEGHPLASMLKAEQLDLFGAPTAKVRTHPRKTKGGVTTVTEHQRKKPGRQVPADSSLLPPRKPDAGIRRPPPEPKPRPSTFIPLRSAERAHLEQQAKRYRAAGNHEYLDPIEERLAAGGHQRAELESWRRCEEIPGADHTSSVEEVETALQGLPEEHLGLFADGELWATMGPKLTRALTPRADPTRSCAIPMGIMADVHQTLRTSDLVVTHNHPVEATFSAQDVDVAIGLGLSEIRVVLPNGEIWSMNGKGATARTWLKHLREATAEVQFSLLEGGLNAREWSQEDPRILALGWYAAAVAGARTRHTLRLRRDRDGGGLRSAFGVLERRIVEAGFDLAHFDLAEARRGLED